MNYISERRCPIYVHEYSKNRSSGTFNNESAKSLGKSTTSKSKSSNSQTSKSVLDKLEETYWATWRPSREKYSKNTKRNRSSSKNDGFGDTSESVIKYFQKSNFKESSASVDDSNCKYGSRPSRSSRLIEVTTQEIQTEDVPDLNQSQVKKVDETTENIEEKEKVKAIKTDTTITENDGSNTTNNNKNAEENDAVPVKDTYVEEEEIVEEVSKSKLLEHKDSFIIHKKKQGEVKEPFQQPKCIKLYKKSASTYLRGGTYPLKSCLRNDTTPKGHFRLGPPGSPMFLTSSSFNRKYAK